jgi:hypothetical protein
MDWDKSVVNTLKTIDYAIRKHPRDELDESEQALLSQMAQDYLSLSPQEAIQQNKVKPEIYVAEAVLSSYGRVNEQKLTRDAVKHCIAENIKQGEISVVSVGRLRQFIYWAIYPSNQRSIISRHSLPTDAKQYQHYHKDG